MTEDKTRKDRLLCVINVITFITTQVRARTLINLPFRALKRSTLSLKRCSGRSIHFPHYTSMGAIEPWGVASLKQEKIGCCVS